jgi:glutamyl-tRNA synthetase
VSVRTRFAPSPTGLLHVGNARTAIFNWLFTRHERGKFVLRIEDTDRERSRPEFEAGIVRELKWLGLDWDEGIDEGPRGPYRQSERHAKGMYREALEELARAGLAYPCFCSAERLESDRQADREAGRMPRYPGRCRSIPSAESRRRVEAGERAAQRFRVGDAPVIFEDRIRGVVRVDSQSIGDPVIFRSDGWPTYNFAVVVDDIGMKITDVIRGEDHLSNTVRQVLLYRALGTQTPRFAHLPLVLGEDRAPLSKRNEDTSLRQFAEQGYPPASVINCLALLGWSAADGVEVLEPPDLIERFDLSRISKAAAVFDRAKLDHLGNQHLRRMDLPRLVDLALPRLREIGLLPDGPGAREERWAEAVLELIRESISRLDQIDSADAVKVLARFAPEATLTSGEPAQELQEESARRVIREFLDRLPPGARLSREEYTRTASEVGRRTGARGRSLYHPLRLALTGLPSGPELARIVPLIEEGADLKLPIVVPGCRERCQRVLQIFEKA